MTIQSDRWIREQALNHGMIEPFVEAQRREGCISYGLSSYGYDARVADEFKIFTNVDSATVDPKDFASNSFVDRQVEVCIIPPNSFALARTVEYFRVPEDVLVICLGKSTYARCGNHRQRHAARARLGGACDAGVQQHHAPARQDLRQRRRLPVPVPQRERAVRDELRRPRRQIYGPARRDLAQIVDRHCEERSDAAIQLAFWIASLRSQ